MPMRFDEDKGKVDVFLNEIDLIVLECVMRSDSSDESNLIPEGSLITIEEARAMGFPF